MKNILFQDNLSYSQYNYHNVFGISKWIRMKNSDRSFTEWTTFGEYFISIPISTFNSKVSFVNIPSPYSTHISLSYTSNMCHVETRIPGPHRPERTWLMNCSESKSVVRVTFQMSRDEAKIMPEAPVG